jgi:hypothetical protein
MSSLSGAPTSGHSQNRGAKKKSASRADPSVLATMMRVPDHWGHERFGGRATDEGSVGREVAVGMGGGLQLALWRAHLKPWLGMIVWWQAGTPAATPSTGALCYYVCAGNRSTRMRRGRSVLTSVAVMR